MPGADHFYPPVEGNLGSVGFPPPLGGYGTPPPFPEHVFIDKRPTEHEVRGQLEMLREEFEAAKSAKERENLDDTRVALSLEGTHSLFDPEPLGPITVLVNTDTKITFQAPVKAVKHLEGDLILLTSVVSIEDGVQGIREWPIATFRSWLAVYRDDFVS